MEYDFNDLERRASQFLEQGRPREALAIYLYMADGDPSLDGGYLGVMIARCYEALGELHAAQYWAGRAFEENPTVPDRVEIRERLGPVNIDGIVPSDDGQTS